LVIKIRNLFCKAFELENKKEAKESILQNNPEFTEDQVEGNLMSKVMLVSWNLRNCSDPKILGKLTQIRKKDLSVGTKRGNSTEAEASPFTSTQNSDEKIPILDFVGFLHDFSDYFRLYGTNFFEKMTEYFILSNVLDTEAKIDGAKKDDKW
jgi:hypothetical protein